MSSLYWDQEKAARGEARKALMKEIEKVTDNRFTVTFESDSTGGHICAVVERDWRSDESPYEKLLPSKFMGWRVLMKHVPDGFIDVFYDGEGNRRMTKESD